MSLIDCHLECATQGMPIGVGLRRTRAGLAIFCVVPSPSAACITGMGVALRVFKHEPVGARRLGLAHTILPVGATAAGMPVVESDRLLRAVAVAADKVEVGDVARPRASLFLLIAFWALCAYAVGD